MLSRRRLLQADEGNSSTVRISMHCIFDFPCLYQCMGRQRRDFVQLYKILDSVFHKWLPPKYNKVDGTAQLAKWRKIYFLYALSPGSMNQPSNYILLLTWEHWRCVKSGKGSSWWTTVDIVQSCSFPKKSMTLWSTMMIGCICWGSILKVKIFVLCTCFTDILHIWTYFVINSTSN